MEFKTTCGITFYADECDADYINTKTWYIAKGRNTSYIRGYIGGKKHRPLHRILLGITDKKIFIDHKDGNGLNNCRGNLRLASCSDNIRNQPVRSRYKYKGVKLKFRSSWAANIIIDGKNKYLGSFKTEIEAARAFNEAAIATGNKFYRLNDLDAA